MKDFSDGWLEGPYLNIFPAIAYFELQASVSRKHRDGEKILREFYLLDEHSIMYAIDEALIRNANKLVALPGFDRLRGADLIFACIAYLEKAYLVTLDGHFECVASQIEVLNLNDSRDTPRYRRLFE